MASIDVRQTETIKASADTLWRILGDDFANVGEWASGVAGSSASPGGTPVNNAAPASGRSCEIDGFGKTDERLVKFDVADRTFAYTVDAKKIPSFIKGMRNDWSITEDQAGHAIVTAKITATASGLMGALMAPMMSMKLRSTMKQIFKDLGTYAESGVVSPAKKKALAKAS